MVNVVDRHIIDAILMTENANEAMEYMVKEYAKKSVENARQLIQLISSLADVVIEHKQKEVVQHRQASFWLMVQHETDKMDDTTLFSSMVPVCMARFPSGTSKGGCEAEKRYFKRFLELFKNKKVFSWDKDSGWAYTNGYTDYLKLVEEKIRDGNLGI